MTRRRNSREYKGENCLKKKVLNAKVQEVEKHALCSTTRKKDTGHTAFEGSRVISHTILQAMVRLGFNLKGMGDH